MSWPSIGLRRGVDRWGCQPGRHAIGSRHHTRSSSSCFNVLTRSSSTWQWEPLPPPPYVHSPLYKNLPCSSVPGSHTVVDIGTYFFDTAKREWRHSEDWVLPFHGRAEYVPDLNLWLVGLLLFVTCVPRQTSTTPRHKHGQVGVRLAGPFVTPPSWAMIGTDCSA